MDTQSVRWLVGVCFLAMITAVQSLAHLYRPLSHIGLQELEEMVYW